MQIAYVDGPRFRRSLLAACEYAQDQRAELNRINVFPVPDGDTGTNLALTVRAVADRLRGSRDRELHVVAREAAEAAVMGARGNCGMMLSHFLLGFAGSVRDRDRLGAEEFGDALASGAQSLQSALERPVEGTILTVIRETADAAADAEISDFVPLLHLLVERSRASLARTPDLLPVLRKAGVVDAGAKGFVALLEGVLLFIRGDRALMPEAPTDEAPAGVGAAGVAFDRDGESEQHRFCTEGLVRGRALPEQAIVKRHLRERGDSLIVIRTGDVLKVHIHTDDPDGVFDYLRSVGTLVTHKAEDMRAQHDAIERAAARGHVTLARRPVTIVTDSAADLPDEIVRAHGIRITPLVLVKGDRSYRDGIDLSAADFHARLAGDADALPTTSQPAPADFIETWTRAAEDGEALVGVVLGSTLSGTYASAETAARAFEGAPVHLFDSLGASLLQGLLTLRAAELAELATPPEKIVETLRRLRARSGILFTVETFDRLLASGRVGWGKAFLGRALRLKPVLAVDPGGTVVPVGKALGRRRVREALLGAVDDRIPTERGRLRFGIVHVGCPEIVGPLRDELRRRYGEVEVLSAAATPVIATHLGTGAWGIAWMAEE